MIVTPNEIEADSIIDCDVCIIGSGFAGISIALELESTNRKVVVLAGGVERETVENQDLNKGFVTPKGSHEPLEENRRRAFGGAGIVWGGRCIPFDPIDFKERSWVPYSGWPFSFNELEPYYVRAMELCKAGRFNFNASEVFPTHPKEIIEGIDNENIISSKLERWSTPVNFAKDYHSLLNSSDNISVLLDAHAIKINTEVEKESVSSISGIARNKPITIKAKKYVLACGGIENPRILLSSKSGFYPNGIGNDHDVVGRFYMAHLNGTFAEVDPFNRERIVFNYEKDNEGVYCRRRWWITEEAQEQEKIGNGIFFLHQVTNQEGHRDALFSAVFIAKFLVSILKEKSIRKTKSVWAEKRPEVFSHFRIILKQGWKDIPTLILLAGKRFRKRRLPSILPSVKSASLGLYYQMEQMPNPESRITILEDEVDNFGVPRVNVKIAFTDLDRKTVIEAHKIFIERYKQIGAGNVKFDPKELSRYIEKKLENFNSAAHHLGTTRISQDPKFGVVDANCQVHGITNLFIAGGSVFPTGGHANPTLTIIALSLRLAKFLKCLEDEITK